MNEVDLDSLPDITEDSELDLDSLPEIADESGPSAEPAAPAPAASTPSEAPAPTDAEAAEFARGTADFVDGMDDPGRFRPDAAREPNAAPSGLMEKYAEGASSYRPGTIVSEFGEDAKRRAAEERSGLDEFREAAAAGAKDAAGTIAKGVMNIPSHLNRLYAAVVLDPIDRIAGTQWGAQARANSAEWEAGTDSLIDTNNVVRRSPGGELALEEAAQGSPERLEAIRENDWGLRWGEKAAGLSSMMFNFTLAGGAAGAAGTPVLVGADSAAARDQMFSVAKSNGMSDGDARDYANLAFTVNTIFEGLLCGGGLKPIMNASEKLATGYVLDTSKASFSRIVNGATLGAMRNFLARTAGHSVSTGALLAGQGAANEAIRQKASAEEFDVDKILKAGEDGGIEGLWMGLGFSAAGGITAAKAYRSARRQVASEYANNVMMQTEIPSGRSVLAEINPEGMRDFVKAREDGRVPTAKETDAAGLPPMSEAERSAAADRFIGDGYTSERLAELSEMKSAEIRSAEEAASARPASEPANGFPLPPEDGGFAPTEEQARFAREANLQKGESIVGTEVADGRIAYTTSNGLVVDVAPDGTFETYPAERRADILKARESQARSEASAREARPEEAVKKESGTEAPAPAVEAEGKSAEVKDAAASEAKAPSDPLDAYYAWIEGLGISDSPASMKRFRRETGTRFPSRNPFASKLSDGTAVKAVKVGDKWNVTGKDIAATGATHEEAVANAEKLVAKKADHSVGTEKEPPIEKGADAASESASADVSAKPSDVVGGAENPAAEKTKNGAYPTKVTLSTGEATVSKVGKKWYVSGNDGVKEDAEIGEGRTRKEAIAMAEDVIARSRKAAEDMAARAGVRKNPVSPELDKNVEVRDTSVGNVTPSDEPADKKLVSDNTYPKPEKPKADVNTGAGANASNNEDIDLIDMLNHPEKMEPTPEEAEKFESERKDYREKYVAEQNEKFVEWKDGILKNAFGSDNDYIGIVRGSKSIADYVSKVRSRVSELRSKADDWASRKYKQTGKNIEFDATRDADDVADGRRIRKNATDINEARRANIVEKLRHNADELENGMREDLRKFGLDESYFNNESSEIKHNEPAVKDVSSGNVEQKSEAVAANPKAEAKGPVVKETTSVEQEVLSNAEVGKSPLFDAVSRVADAIDGRDAEGGRAAMDGVRKAIASGEKFPSKEEVDGIASRIVDEGMRRAFVENMDKWREHASASGKTADAAKQPEGPKLDIDEEARGRANGNSHFDAGDVIVRDAGRTYETGMSELADADGWTPGMKEQAAKERAAWKALCEDAANTALRDRARYVPASVAGPAKHDSRRMGAAADAAVSRAAEFAEKQARFLENAKRRIADLKPDEEKIAEYRDGRNEDPIQSDDPLAVEKLDARVSCLEERHENGKAMNAWLRRNGTMAGFPGIDPDVAKRMDEHVKADPIHYTPYPKYAASSATANIRRLKERRAEAARLRASAKDGPRTEEHEWGAVVENAADGRIQVSFGEKPSKETAQKLRRSGFKWSPSSGVWQRTLTENARRDAKSLASELDADYGVAPAAEQTPARADDAVRSRGLKSTVHDIMGDILRDAGLADEAPAPEAEAVPAEAPVQAEPAAKSEPQRPNADVIAAMNRRNREAGMRPDQLKAEIERKRNDQSIPQSARDAIVKDLQTLLDYKTKTGSAENPEERPAGFRAMKAADRLSDPEFVAECEERGIKPTEANRRMLDLEKAKRIQKKLANFIPDVKVDVVDALPEETNHLHDGDGMTVGAFDRSTGRIYLLPGADAETVGHELLGHAMRMYAEQLARKGDGALLGRLNEVAASAPKEVWDHLRENYGIESGEELLDELFSTRLGRETRAKLEAALKTDAARKWYVRVWDAVKDLWRSFAAKFGGNRIDLSAVDDMTPDETVDFIVDQALRGRTLGTLDMEGGESGVREMRPRFTKPVPGSLMDMRGKWRDAGDTYMREMADRHHDLLSFERDLEKATGVRLDKKDSIYYQMRLLPGKNEYARVVLEATMNRYLDFLKRNGDRVTKEDVAKFVYGTFAPERNARLKAKLNVDDGSGVSDAEAAAWLDDLRARGIYDLCREGADIVRRGYEQFGLDNLLDAGMTDQATVDRMRREEPNYVPLRTDVTTEDGLDLNSVRSSEMPTFRTATGRSEEADDPLAFMLIQAMDNAVRANVNRAVRRLADIVRRNPTLGIGKVRGPKVVGTDADGNPVFDDRYNERDNPFLVAFRENGKKKYVELDGTRRGLLLAEAVRGTGPDGKSVVANLPGWYLKRFQEWMSLATRRSLGFLSRNLPKDTVEVGADLMATSGLRPGLGFAKDQLADMAKTAFGAVPVAGRLTRNDTVHRALGNFLEKGDISGPYANELKEFVESGALIGGASREGYADLEERMDAVQGRVGRRFGAVGRPIGAVGRAIRSTFGWIDLQNEIAENVSRFNNFRRRRKNGESVEDAAIASREGSTDFNMFGRQRWLNGIRAFANSILGGTMRATRSALFGRYGRRLSASMFAEGMLEAFLDHLMNAGYDEEAEREGRPSGRDVPEYERSQTIRLRSGDRYVRIPMHVGPWSALKYTGDCVARYMLGELGGWKATKNIINEWKTVGVHFGGAGDVNLKTFEDDDGPSTVNSAAPTIAQLPMQLDANEDHAGRQIHKDTSGPQYEGLPKHLFARGSTSGFWTKLSRIMNRVGAGGDTEAGNPLFDSHPESYRYVAKGVFKNVGDDIVNAWDSVAAAFGDAPPDGFDWKTAPLAGTFYRNVPNNDRRYAEERVRFTRSLNQYGHDRTSDERRREIHGAMPAVEGAYDENLRKGRPYLSRLADEIAELRRMEDGFYRPHEVSADGKGTRRGAWRQREITREERAGIAAKRRALQARFILEMRRMDEAARGK